MPRPLSLGGRGKEDKGVNCELSIVNCELGGVGDGVLPVADCVGVIVAGLLISNCSLLIEVGVACCVGAPVGVVVLLIINCSLLIDSGVGMEVTRFGVIGTCVD